MRVEDVPSLFDAALNQPSPITADNEWVYRKSTNELQHRRPSYYVDLDRCITSAAVLDFVFQVFNKLGAHRKRFMT